MVRSTLPQTFAIDDRDMFLANRLAGRRAELGISLTELAEAIDISEEEYSAYESGREEMPASVVFLASVILGGDPLKYLQELESLAPEQSVLDRQAV